MSIATYRNTSVLYNTPIIDKWYLGYYVHRIILPKPDDIFVPSLDKKYMYRPDNLSYDMYGIRDYYWVFASRNMDIIKDPIWDMVEGISFYIPKITSIKSGFANNTSGN